MDDEPRPARNGDEQSTPDATPKAPPKWTTSGPTSADAFKAEAETLYRNLELPSGKVVRVKGINLLSLLRSKLLPAWDLDRLRREAARSGRTMDVIRSLHINPGDFLEMILLGGIVAPKVTGKAVGEEGPDEVSLDRFHNEDLAAMLDAIAALSGFTDSLSEFGFPFPRRGTTTSGSRETPASSTSGSPKPDESSATSTSSVPAMASAPPPS